MPRHKLTSDDRRRGQAKGAATKRKRRDEVEQEAREQLSEAVSAAVTTLVAQLEAENPADRIRAASAILDRAWGKPRQALEHAGSVALTPTVVYPDVDAASVLTGLEELGLIRRGPAAPAAAGGD
jgi:hypothetical protein